MAKHLSRKRNQNSPSESVSLLQCSIMCSSIHVWDSSLAFCFHRAAPYFFLSHCHHRLRRKNDVCYKFPSGWTNTPVHLSGNSLWLYCITALALATSPLFSLKSVFYQALNYYNTIQQAPDSCNRLECKVEGRIWQLHFDKTKQERREIKAKKRKRSKKTTSP